MGAPRFLGRAPRRADPSQDACLDAFDHELDYIFATFRRLGANPADTEDLAQELFLVLQRKWPTIDTARPLRPYLFGIAFRLCCAHRRRRRETVSETIELTASDSDDPETAMQQKETSALLMAALDRIPLHRRVVIVMHDIDGVPVSEVARQLSISRFGVYARLRKGHRELTAALRTMGGAAKRMCHRSVASLIPT